MAPGMIWRGLAVAPVVRDVITQIDGGPAKGLAPAGEPFSSTSLSLSGSSPPQPEQSVQRWGSILSSTAPWGLGTGTTVSARPSTTVEYGCAFFTASSH